MWPILWFASHADAPVLIVTAVLILGVAILLPHVRTPSRRATILAVLAAIVFSLLIDLPKT